MNVLTFATLCPFWVLYTITIRSIRYSTQISVTAPSLWGAHTSGLPRGGIKLDSRVCGSTTGTDSHVGTEFHGLKSKPPKNHLKQHNDHLRLKSHAIYSNCTKDTKVHPNDGGFFGTYYA